MRKRIQAARLFSALVAVMLAVGAAAPVIASPTTATRTLPSYVESGAEFEINIRASGCGAFGQVVETLPAGFTYLSRTPDDIGVEQVGSKVKFTFLKDSVSFIYVVKAPTVDTAITYTLHGVVKDEDKNEYPIEEDDITVAGEDSGEELSEGPNFVTYKGLTRAVADAVANMPSGVLVSVWHFDNREKKWEAYIPDAPAYASDLEQMVHLQPYVVVVTEDFTWVY